MRTEMKYWLAIFTVLLIGIGHGKEYTWSDYGRWVDVTNDVAKINEAKRAAVADERPMLVLYSRPGSDCTHCKALWEGALCDGGSKCSGASCPLYRTHPWATYAKEKKVILLYVNISLNQDLLTYLNNQHRFIYTGAYPVFALFHVKSSADFTTTSKGVVLDPKNVDCLGASFYAVGNRIPKQNGVVVANTFDSFKGMFEAFFEPGMETYGLELEPEEDDASEPVADLETLTMEDFTTGNAKTATMTADKGTLWYGFTAESGKTYHFKFTRTYGSTDATMTFFENTGTASAPNYDSKKPLQENTLGWGDTISWTASSSSQILLKVRSNATASLRYTMMYLQTPNGYHLLNPSKAASKARWCDTYNALRPQVVAFIENDVWNDSTLALAKAVRTADFTDNYSSAYWYVLTDGQGTLQPESKPELVYISKDGKELGRLSGSFGSASMKRFAQYAALESDAYDPDNNEIGTIPAGDVLKSNITINNVKIGGVDEVDWYAFQSTADNQKWIFTVAGGNASAVSLSMADGTGKAVAATVEGNTISYMVPARGTTLYVKLTAETEELFDYILSAEIKVANYSVQFGDSDYTVMADADYIEIPVVLNKINYQAGAISVTLKLDNSSFGNGMILFDRYQTQTTVTWTAGENPRTGSPKAKNVKVFLHDAELDEFWPVGTKELPVTVSFIDTGLAEPAAENTTATLHIRNVNIPTFVGEDGDGSSLISYETYASAQPDASQKKIVANCIAAPEKYMGNEIFWELIDGQIPEGVDIDIQQHAQGDRNYDVVISGASKESAEMSARLLFFMRKDAGKKQIIRGDEFTIDFAISERRSVDAATRSGWNLMAIPWDMKLNEESEQEFHETNAGNVFSSDGKSYVKDDAPLKPGSAYWVFVKEGGQNPLTGVKDESEDEAQRIEKALQGKDGTWYFGTDPGVEKCEARWIWDGKKFVPAEGDAKGKAGWWYLKKD